MLILAMHSKKERYQSWYDHRKQAQRRRRNDYDMPEAISQFIENSSLRLPAMVWRLRHRWAEFAGPVIAEQTEQVWFQEGVLYVRLKTPVWKTELMYQRETMRDGINHQLGTDLIREVMLV